MNMKKLGLVALVVTVALSQAEMALAQEHRVLRFASVQPNDHPTASGIAAMNECLFQKTNGALEIRGLWNGVLGGDLESAQAARSGTLEMLGSTNSPLASMVPALGMFDMPYLFNDVDEAQAVLTELRPYISDLTQKAGLVTLGIWDHGFRNLTNSKHPVYKLEDFDGLKIRVQQNNIFMDSFKMLGANPVPMSLPEVYPALETKAIDGQENPTISIYSVKFYEVQKYLSETKHAYSPLFISMSKIIWDQLPEEQQTVLVECADNGRTVLGDLLRVKSEQAAEALKAEGMEINTLESAEVNRIRERLQPLYDKYSAQIGPEVMKTVLNVINKHRQ